MCRRASGWRGDAGCEGDCGQSSLAVGLQWEIGFSGVWGVEGCLASFGWFCSWLLSALESLAFRLARGRGSNMVAWSRVKPGLELCRGQALPHL